MKTPTIIGTLKNKICFVTLILIVASSFNSFGQLNIEASLGYHTYDMSMLKEAQNEGLSTIPFNAQITDDFPSYFGYDFLGYYSFNSVSKLQFGIGLLFNYTSTGGRISYSDYSGTFYDDQRLTRTGSGVFLTLEYLNSDRFTLSFDCTPTLTVSTMDLIYHLNIYKELYEHHSLEAQSIGLNIHLGVKSKVYVYKNIYTFGKIGYEIDALESNMYVTGEGDIYLTNTEGDPIYPNWTGLRFSLGIGGSLFRN
ncbi:hypothetical protein [Reichenbachiella ulvae]|uniref:Outer membrane protein beta-barrel domain-containing protein n=1 Tax=Reichenbachiella ulvae TaxID=2980104 RepID=A0ABT3CVW1_9BACT|nr:hypothetical protein [Reichenbachiella ulvae]MCV9387683.1 hypothetical protein [Reichenbachiella ulvae]